MSTATFLTTMLQNVLIVLKNFICFSSFVTSPEVGGQWAVALGAVGLVVLSTILNTTTRQ